MEQQVLNGQGRVVRRYGQWWRRMLQRSMRDLAPMIADIRAAGHVSLRAMAVELTVRGIRTRRGGQWGVGNVRGLIQRFPQSLLDQRS